VTNSVVRSTTNIYVYELTTRSDTAAETSVRAICLGVFGCRTIANFVVWTVAATIEQCALFQTLPWVRISGPFGPMNRVGDQLIFRHHQTGDMLSTSLAELVGERAS
jgi:hypothetical protein